jgi:hypothetical protein
MDPASSVLALCINATGDRTPAFPEGNHLAAAIVPSQDTG